MAKPGKWREKALALHAEQPSRSHAAIASECGVTRSAVSKLLNPEGACMYSKRDNDRSERRAAKRAWDRSDAGRGICAQCNKPKGIAGYRRTLCRDCWGAEQKEKREMIVELRREGLLNTEIAARVGYSYASVTTILHRERKRDPSIPRSPHYVTERAA